MAASIEAPSAGPRSRRSCGKRPVIAFTASYTAFWTSAMVRIVLGPSVAISVVLSAQSATVSARAPSATDKRAMPQQQMDNLMNSPSPLFRRRPVWTHALSGLLPDKKILYHCCVALHWYLFQQLALVSFQQLASSPGFDCCVSATIS